MTPRISSAHLRVDVGGVPAIDGLTFGSTGDHVLILGAARALFEAAAGLRPVTRGDLLLDGVPVRQAVRDGAATSAELDPRLPGHWTARRYVTWSARLFGHDRRVARELAGEALDRLQLSSVSEAKLRSVSLAVRRAVVVAAALSTDATLLLFEDPAQGLADEAAQNLSRALARATSDRATITFAPRMALE